MAGLSATRQGAEPPAAGQGASRASAGAGAEPHGAFASFLGLERAARRAESVRTLDWLAVNDTRTLVDYRQAVLVVPKGRRGWSVAAVAGVSTPDADAPATRWFAEALQRLAPRPEPRGGGDGTARPVTRADLDDPALAAAWERWAAPYGLICPLAAPPDPQPQSLLLLVRESAWTERERVLVERLAEAYGHARRALSGGPPRAVRPGRRRALAAVGLAALAGALAWPVTQTALAPAEVVPDAPWLVAAPLQGVIASVAVEPNQPVTTGDLLFVYDDTELRSARAVAERTLAIAEAELRRARQAAFADSEQGARLAVLEARRALRAAELDRAEERLSRIWVAAERPGVAVFADARDWVGRPVAVGERVMTIADPARVRLRADLPAGDSIVLAEGAAVTLFLDAAPLAPRQAEVTAAAYEAAPTPDGTLAYPVQARFVDGRPPPRIGLRGTARIAGARVPLAFYLFRRPIAWVRGTLGL